MKIYTKAGDNGETSLCDGEKVSKADTSVCACGEVDELNCVLGEILSKTGPKFLEKIQKDLFNIGSLLACAKVDIEFDSGELEKEIDRVESALPELKAFIMPGGNELSSKLHVARAVCRRAERSVCRIPNNTATIGQIIQYLNRLSDLLFVLARYTNMKDIN